MICKFTKFYYTQSSTSPLGYTFSESRTARSAPVYSEAHEQETMVWIKGVDTTGKADDQLVNIDTPLRVSGTTKYNTVEDSTKTLFVLEPGEAIKVKTVLK